MRSTIVVTALVLSLFLPSFASAADWKAMIAADRVKVANGKMTLEEYSLCKVTVPGAAKSSIQVRSFAEAPVGAGISRDFFVAFQAMNETFLVLAMGYAVANGTTVDVLRALDCDPIAAPIGKVDIEINVYMTSDGFQLAVVDGTSGETTQESQRWEDAFGAK